jgi:hypothetical protein
VNEAIYVAFKEYRAIYLEARYYPSS